jgi:cell division protein FtsB
MEKKQSMTVPILFSVLVTALVVGGLMYWIMQTPEEDVTEPGAEEQERQEEIEQLQQEIATLNEQVANLSEERDQLQRELEELREAEPGESGEQNMTPQPNAGWETYFPDPDTTTLEGASPAEVYELLGEPPFKIRSTAANPTANREIWVYLPYAEDPTGLYLFFKGDQLWSSQLDEFGGLYQSGLLEDEDFWLN